MGLAHALRPDRTSIAGAGSSRFVRSASRSRRVPAGAGTEQLGVTRTDAELMLNVVLTLVELSGLLLVRRSR
ncbi:hypothetical protein Ae168Ps1_6232c [Pseudonocardia sp. Ae168_Ps1]|nr:hypothetical protein Ae168Ps1_6232c [Pseudonocardia sp. Ae168_Ps1]OLL71604.1 hypothetical protein Ae263Ps1_6092c [Pseudonocardia sp. Ae263_Ps1]